MKRTSACRASTGAASSVWRWSMRLLKPACACRPCAFLLIVVSPLGSEDDAVRAQGLEIMRKAIQFAQDVGIRVIQLAGYDVYHQGSQ